MRNETRLRRKVIELSEQVEIDKKLAFTEKGMQFNLGKAKVSMFGFFKYELIATNTIIVTDRYEGVVMRIELGKPQDNINKALENLNITLL